MTTQNQVKLKLLYDCNEDCIFCTEKVNERDRIKYMGFVEVKALIDEYSKEENVFLVLTGGEPTIRNDIIKIIRYARKKKIKNIAMQTNGVRFADKIFTHKLVQAGLTFVSVTLAGHNAAIHDAQTNLKGSFEKTMRGIKNLVNSGIRVMAYVVVSNSNFREIDKLAEMLVKEFPKLEQIQLTMPCVSGGALANFYEVVPQFSLSYKYVIKAMDIIIKSGIELTVDNLPLCFIEGYEKYSSEIKTYLKEREGALRTFHAEMSNNALQRIANYTNLRRKKKVKGIHCNLCVYDYYCDGVWEEYAKRYTLNELNPIIS